MAVKTLYVGNLPYTTTESHLTSHFANYGATNARIMEGRGFVHEAREVESGRWEVLFTPLKETAAVDTSADADAPEAWPDPSLHLDLSDLDPPEPMVRILAAAEELAEGDVLFALLSREPVFLFPELTRRGHQWAGNFDGAGTGYRMLVRVGRPKE